MDKKLIAVDDLTEVARDYNEKIDQKILEAIGVTRRLQELVKADQDAIANLDTLENTLAEIKTKLTGAGVEVSTCQVIDLTGYIDELAGKIPPLNQRIQTLTQENSELTQEKTRLEGENATLTREKQELQAQITEAETQLEVLI